MDEDEKADTSADTLRSASTHGTYASTHAGAKHV